MNGALTLILPILIRRPSSMKSRLPFVIATLLCALAPAAPGHAIVGPTVEASPFADRVVMVLTRGPHGSGFCTGVVLSPTVILTAAHCLRPPGDMLVHYRDEAGAPVVLDVVSAKANPGYRPDAAVRRTRSLDVGLIETKTPLAGWFQPAVLATGSPPDPGDLVTAVGFGVSAEHKPATGGTLRATRLVVREPRSSVLLWLKGAYSGSGACSGDSGGPIFTSNGTNVVALTAWTEGGTGAECGQLTQGVLLAPVADWILAYLAHRGDAASTPGKQ